MVDLIDQAQAAEEAHREESLAAHQRRVVACMHARRPGEDADCLRCGREIEAQRRRTLPLTDKCAACAHDYERELRNG